MCSCPAVLSHSVPEGSQSHKVLHCPSKRAAEVPAWRKHAERMGCHLLVCRVFIKSEILIWYQVPVGREREFRNEGVETECVHLPSLPMTHSGILCFLSLLLKGNTSVLEDSRGPIELPITVLTNNRLEGTLESCVLESAGKKKSHRTSRGN